MAGLLSLQLQFSIAVLIVLAARLLMKKMPKIYCYALWLLVFARLLFPFSMELERAVMPKTEFVHKVNYEVMKGSTGIFINGTPIMQSFKNYELLPGGDIVLQDDGESKNEEMVRFALIAAWFVGTTAILAYNCAALWKVREKIKDAVCLKENIYVSGQIPAPFTIGISEPKIYIPESLAEEERDYIICHEQIHAKRKDNFVKNLAFFLTAVYWFNPLCWIAFHFLEQDMEMSCDEAVIRKMGGEIRRQYSQSLLDFAAGQKTGAFTPLTFGEVSVKQRVKNVLKKRKAGKWIGLLGAVLVLSAAVLIFTEKKPSAQPEPIPGKEPHTENAAEKEVTGELSRLSIDSEGFVWEWARAFSNKDRETQIEYMSEPMKSEAQARYAEDGHTFGTSSPWPGFVWSAQSPAAYDAPYVIDEIVWDSADSGHAVIRYYAMASDPHIWVWKEKMELVRDEKGKFLVSSSVFERYEEISSAEQFYEAYPNGEIDGMMNYRRNGVGAVLNHHALTKDHPSYSQLLEPETAAVSLLNLSKESEAVKVSGVDGAVTVKIHFQDQSQVSVRMVQPYGTDGIWIPQSDENFSDLEQFALDWRVAFCQYDRLAQMEMMSEPLKSRAAAEYKEYPEWAEAKGWNLIWPYGELVDYILGYTKSNIMEAMWETPETGKVVICEFPMDRELLLMTVLRQELTVRLDESGKILVEDLDFKYYDEISGAEQFYEAYPSLDELFHPEDPLIEAWNQNATTKNRENDSIAYEEISGWLEPEKAASEILHLSADCKITMDQEADEFGTLWMKITFPDESEIFIKMIQPFGEDGIWIPQDGRQ